MTPSMNSHRILTRLLMTPFLPLVGAARGLNRAVTADRVKLAADVTLAVLLLIPAAPLIVLSALLVKLTSRGPAFYSQVRLGLNGREFRIYKIRTMYHNCEAGTGARWSTPGDPRVTPVGKFLRKTHLDELPQLWNILRGDMSLVGPRPERPEIAPKLEAQMPSYRQRLKVRPGLTGLAQIQLPPDSSIADVRRKLARDLYYVRNGGLWLDLRILVGTVGHVLGVPAALTTRLLGLPTAEDIDPGEPKPPEVGALATEMSRA